MLKQGLYQTVSALQEDPRDTIFYGVDAAAAVASVAPVASVASFAVAQSTTATIGQPYGLKKVRAGYSKGWIKGGLGRT